MPTPVHIIAGFLGAGKTTTVRAWMAAHQGAERAAVIVNDFGEAGIDASLVTDGLPGAVPVINIPGGCVCCTAPAGLARAVSTVLDEVRPDRLFIEPSGLARPQDVVDMLTRGDLKGRVVLGPTIVVVDPSAVLDIAGAAELLATQLEAGDVLVLNRVDLASPEALATFRARIATLWPGPARVIETSFGALPDDALEWPAGAGPAVRYAAARGPVESASTEGFRARSWVYPPDVRVSWDKLRDLLQATPDLARFKGLFSGDVGWFRVDIAGGQLHFAGTAWRRDSRADLIVGPAADLDAFAAALDACILPDETAPTGPGVTLVDLDGFELHVTREALAGLAGQVPDVGARVPGRSGVAVLLREVLALVPAPAGGRFVVSATDGMTTAPAPLAGIGGALLVYALDGEPLPDTQGGPFRLLVPPGEAANGCAAVKGVARIRVLPGA
ncbi:MAG: GTP-binding protein [Pseudomonadota bacterium]|nr:GTP-binding protein [Pseudomonadota bacterium]